MLKLSKQDKINIQTWLDLEKEEKRNHCPFFLGTCYPVPELTYCAETFPLFQSLEICPCDAVGIQYVETVAIEYLKGNNPTHKQIMTTLREINGRGTKELIK